MRGDRVAKAQRELAQLTQRRSEIATETEQAERELVERAEASGALDELEGLVALGELDRRQADRKRAEIENPIVEAEEKLRGLRAAVAELDRRIEQAREALHTARCEALTAERRAAYRAESETSTRLGKALAEVLSLADALAADRERTKGLETELAGLLPDDEELPEADRDEPAWRPDGYERLVALLERGPLTPDADRAEHEHRAARERANREAQLVADAVRFLLGTPAGFSATEHDELREARLGQLPEHLRAEALRREARLREAAGRPVSLGAA